MSVTIHTLTNCPWCVKAKALLTAMGLEYEEVLGRHPDWPTAPYIVIDGKPIGGFTELADYARS